MILSIRFCFIFSYAMWLVEISNSAKRIHGNFNAGRWWAAESHKRFRTTLVVLGISPANNSSVHPVEFLTVLFQPWVDWQSPDFMDSVELKPDLKIRIKRQLRQKWTFFFLPPPPPAITARNIQLQQLYAGELPVISDQNLETPASGNSTRKCANNKDTAILSPNGQSKFWALGNDSGRTSDPTFIHKDSSNVLFLWAVVYLT